MSQPITKQTHNFAFLRQGENPKDAPFVELFQIEVFYSALPKQIEPACFRKSCKKTTDDSKDAVVCEKCLEAIYCSQSCLRKDWPHHKKVCVVKPQTQAKK